ncbi:MAG: DNA-3-methyladenine glycosylase 2 family protein [Acidobacteria bacterium]|nr:DNA-3-methyladenine glycosylase 2 family protein [Acidobacteriota bacterium]
MKKALLHLEAADPVLGNIIRQVGPYAITYHAPDFTALARSIVYQQLSGKAAATIFARVLAAAGRGGKLSPTKLIALGPEGLRPHGLSQQKASYLVDLATRRIPFSRLPALPDSEVLAALTAVKGVGVWTAQMFLMFALERPDIFPTGDLGIRNAIQKAYDLPTPPTPAEMERIAQPWRPYASVSTWYLWRFLDGAAGFPTTSD